MARNFALYEEKLEIPKKEEGHQMVVLGKILQAIQQERFEDLEEHFADDMEMDIHGFAELEGSWNGKAAVLQGLRRNFGLVEEQRPVVLEMVEAGGRIALRFEESGRMTKTHARYAVRGMQWFRFEGNQLRYFEQYIRTIPVMPEGAP